MSLPGTKDIESLTTVTRLSDMWKGGNVTITPCAGPAKASATSESINSDRANQPTSAKNAYTGSLAKPDLVTITSKDTSLIASSSHLQSNGLQIKLTGINQKSLKEGQAKCKHCGSIGVKHAFYTKDKNLCSPECIKAVVEINRGRVTNQKYTTLRRSEIVSDDSRSSTPTSRGSSVPRQETSRPSSSASMTSSTTKPKKKKTTKQPAPIPIEQSFDWAITFRNPNLVAAPVSCFKHVPVAHVWDNVTEGMKVEVRNSDVNPAQYRLAFWVASVIRICGYNALLRFEGFGEDSSRDFWSNLCTTHVHPVGWCATKEKPLMPPSIIANKYDDWRDFLVGRLTGARTLPQNFQVKVDQALRSKFDIGTKLEVVDKNRICRVRLATVKSTIGKRLNLMYFDSLDDDIGFWCHDESPLIHPCGWAGTVGHELLAPATYNPKPLPATCMKFKQPFSHIQVKVGMKLEVIDPLNLSAICAGTVKRVLKFGYLMVRVDCYEEDPYGADWFCHHLTSSSIFPCGFSKQNKVALTPPCGYDKETFTWNQYFQETGTKPVPLHLITKDVLEHNLKVGMKLEACDLMDPRLICVATVGEVVGSLLKIRFDGWEEEYDQWLDASSPDIYPVGYCELIGHKLEKPPQRVVAKKAPKTHKKGRKKTKRPFSSSSDAPKEKKVKEMKPDLSALSSTLKTSRQSSTSSAAAQLKLSTPAVPEVKPNALSAESKILDNRILLQPASSNRVTSPPGINANVPEEGNSKLSSCMTDVWNGTSSQNNTGASVGTKTASTTIPKLTSTLFSPDMPGVDPDSWTIQDVGEFLKVNDCGTYCESFEHNKLDGPKLLGMTKEQIIVLTKMKVGPALKIFDLIGQLKRIANHVRAKKEEKSKVPV